nr:hypothetical protein [Naumannella halotolerans]
MRLSALRARVELKIVTFGVFEGCDSTPRVVADAPRKIHPGLLQTLDLSVNTDFRSERDDRSAVGRVCCTIG